MRVLFLTDNFPPETNASASRVYERALYWVREGWEVTVLTSAPNFPEGRVYPGHRNAWYRREDMDGIDVVRVKTFITANEGTVLRTLDFASYMVTAVIAGLFERRPDVIVATSPQFLAAVGGWMLAALRRVPFVFELGDLWPASIAAVGAMRPGKVLRAMERLELFLYRRAAAVVALTPSFKDNLVGRGIAPGKIEVVINGVELSRYRPQPRDEALAAELAVSGRLVVGYIGTHGMAHGLENVLSAAALMRDEPGVCFLLVGGGAAREALLQHARAEGLDNVRMVPAQPKAEVGRYWSLCDVALIHLKDSPIFSTVIPSKTFEAMAHGLPVLLAAPSGEVQRIVEGEGAGLWVPAGDPTALAQAVRRLRDDPGLRQRLGQQALAAAPRYSRERQARAMAAVLERVAVR